MHPTAQTPATATHGTNSPTGHDEPHPVAHIAHAADAGVGEYAEDELHERAITAAGLDVERLMSLRQDALQRYQATNCLSDKGEADQLLIEASKAAELMRALILNRSPEYVAKLECERGLR